jgi:hypothetical protein
MIELTSSYVNRKDRALRSGLCRALLSAEFQGIFVVGKSANQGR